MSSIQRAHIQDSKWTPTSDPSSTWSRRLQTRIKNDSQSHVGDIDFKIMITIPDIVDSTIDPVWAMDHIINKYTTKYASVAPVVLHIINQCYSSLRDRFSDDLEVLKSLENLQEKLITSPVIDNLIKNASKFTENREKLQVIHRAL